VRVSAVTAALMCIPLSLASGILAGSLHLVAVAAGWAYDLGLKASRASVLTFVVNMSLSPLFVVYGLPGSPHPPWWLPAVTTLLGCGAHFGNVLRDLEDDLATGVRGLPQRLGTATSRVLSVTLTLAAVVLLAATSPLRPAIAVGTPLVAVLILAAGVPHRRWAPLAAAPSGGLSRRVDHGGSLAQPRTGPALSGRYSTNCELPHPRCPPGGGSSR
jgi:4-hydroxybenzoate polyprenyltransferase